MKEQLTPKQIQVLEAIKSFLAENGFPPTVRELADMFGQSSTAGIHKLLMVLQKKGALRKGESGKSRSYNIIGDTEIASNFSRARACPIVGIVEAGMPNLAIENREGELYLDSEWVGQDDTFLLKVHGYSMIDANIYEGDLLVVQMTQSCHNGDIIIALLEDEATVKRFFKEKDRIRLQPENPTMQPIYISADDLSFHIIGKVKGLLRKF